MEYTVKGLSELSGVTPRTLRWYDRLELLKPGRTTEAGYRLYGPAEVDRLQQILFFRELGLPLAEIRDILDAPNFDRQAALQSHLLALRQRRKQLDTLIGTVEQTLLKEKGEIDMSDKEKFEGFKREKAEENDRLYGAEARERYGSGPVEEARKNWMGLSREKFHCWQELDRELREGLAVSVQAGNDPSGPEGKHLARLHREWLSILMPDCDDARQAGIAELYVADERFTAYYDREVPGCARFLWDAVRAHIDSGK
jgi:DNA-binding transcriptional MerR regulator